MIVERVEAHATSRDAADKLVGEGVPADDWRPNVRGPAVVIDADTGAPIMVVGRFGGDLASLRRAMIGYPMNTTVRAVGIRNRSNVFGFTAKHVMMQRNGCRVCHGAAAAPDAHARIVAAGAECAALLASMLPDKAAADLDTAAGEIREEWRLPGSPWTSGVLNLTSPLPYHYDRNNLPTWSAMVVCRRGVTGGHLHVPEYDLVVECRDGDVVMFPGWDLVHGVTPLDKVDRDGYRYSAVFYTVEGMKNCLPPAEEMARARRDRTRRESDVRSNTERLGRAARG